ncbi:hypothetical protein [Calothrix sp. NIES-3974]|uniref:hypothetical protein n=1 Tax=Calothrix sp. NIES-3974 TaxID=2005462 RepID=UPI0012FE160D|nr:hypothetical protein [Calothrix sp. NIES-3974]
MFMGYFYLKIFYLNSQYLSRSAGSKELLGFFHLQRVNTPEEYFEQTQGLGYWLGDREQMIVIVCLFSPLKKVFCSNRRSQLIFANLPHCVLQVWQKLKNGNYIWLFLADWE